MAYFTKRGMFTKKELSLENLNLSDTILIVDDSEINRAVLANIFSSSYQIQEAENGKVALEKLIAHKQEICAILLDVVMPVMDGIEVLEKLDALGWMEQIPVFLITAEAAGDTLQKAYSMGVMDVIAKPVVPYIVQRRIGSVIELFRARKRLSCTVEEQRTEISEQAKQILQLNMGMIEALSTAIEFRSGESGGHVRRIHDITRILLTCTQLGNGLTSDTITQISLAAIMHDVGKIAIPDAVLNKPGKLTPQEFELMKTHTIQGGLLLQKIPQIKEHTAFIYAYDIARHHHERWDGTGYPDGLKGEEISVWSQIVSIADVYDALVSKRVYKDAFPAEKALDMIRRGECGVFNPMLLRCFLETERDIRRIYDSEEIQ